MIQNLAWMLLLTPLIVVANDEAIDGNNEALPLTIELTQDVQVRSSSDGLGQQRGTLYAATDFRISKGQRFQMIVIGQEGGCRIEFQDAEHELFSCPWLPGFRDHQPEIFVVLSSEKSDEK